MDVFWSHRDQHTVLAAESRPELSMKNGFHMPSACCLYEVRLQRLADSRIGTRYRFQMRLGQPALHKVSPTKVLQRPSVWGEHTQRGGFRQDVEARSSRKDAPQKFQVGTLQTILSSLRDTTENARPQKTSRCC